jgi:hypothetical protein
MAFSAVCWYYNSQSGCRYSPVPRDVLSTAFNELGSSYTASKTSTSELACHWLR